MAMPIQYNIGEIVFALEDMFNDGGLPGYAGATLIGDGRLALILDVDALRTV